MSTVTAGHAQLSRNTRPRRGHFVLEGGRGAVLQSVDGRRVLDFSSQTVNLLFGQGHPAIHDAVRAQLLKYTFVDQDFGSVEDEMAVEALSKVLPAHLVSYNLRMCNGTDAVEAAVKQARRATGRSRVLTLDGVYLGASAQTIHFRGLSPRPSDIVRGGHEDVVFGPLPLCADHDHEAASCPRENGELLCGLIAEQRDVLACILIDPVMISSGVFVGRAMQSLLRTVSEECHRHGIPLILDECQSFGWVPEHTLSALWAVEPDALTLAKGVAGGLPLAVCATTAALDNLEWGEADFTHGGHAISLAALRATVKLLTDPREAASFESLQRTLSERIDELAPGRWRSRGLGLIYGLELVDSDGSPSSVERARRVSELCLERGVYIRPYRACLGVKPPRSITEDQLVAGLDIIASVVDVAK